MAGNPKAEDFEWRLTAHICRACLGRVLTRSTFDHKRIYRCSNCGCEREGRTETALCCCGIAFGKVRRDAGIRCVPNPLRTPECMSEVVAIQLLAGGKPVQATIEEDPA